MGFDVSLVESLEKYGLFGLLVFGALVAGAGTWWKSLVGAAEAYQQQEEKDLRPLLFRPAAMFLLVLVPLIVAQQVVSSKTADLRRAATLLDGRWDASPLGCVQFRVDRDRGMLVTSTRDGFHFLHEIEALSKTQVQVRQRGRDDPVLYKSGGDGILIERPLGGGDKELKRC